MPAYRFVWACVVFFYFIFLHKDHLFSVVYLFPCSQGNAVVFPHLWFCCTKWSQCFQGASWTMLLFSAWVNLLWVRNCAELQRSPCRRALKWSLECITGLPWCCSANPNKPKLFPRLIAEAWFCFPGWYFIIQHHLGLSAVKPASLSVLPFLSQSVLTSNSPRAPWSPYQ